MREKPSSGQPHVLLGEKSRPTPGPGTSGFQVTRGSRNEEASDFPGQWRYWEERACAGRARSFPGTSSLPSEVQRFQVALRLPSAKGERSGHGRRHTEGTCSSVAQARELDRAELVTQKVQIGTGFCHTPLAKGRPLPGPCRSHCGPQPTSRSPEQDAFRYIGGDCFSQGPRTPCC